MKLNMKTPIAPPPNKPELVTFEFPVRDKSYFLDAAARRRQVVVNNKVLDRHIAKLAVALIDLLKELPDNSASPALSVALDGLRGVSFRVQAIKTLRDDCTTPIAPTPVVYR